MSLLLTVSGNDSVALTEVSLVKLLGSEEIDGVVKPQESGSFLVEFEAPPLAEFVVRVKGQREGVTNNASANFQRVTSTSFRSSNLTITVSMSRHEQLSACNTCSDPAPSVLPRPIPMV